MTDSSDRNRAQDELEPSNPSTSEPGVSRRNFMFRLAQTGAALSVGAPFIRDGLTRWAPLEDASRTLGANATQRAVTDLYSGLRWRMIGPFRGGRVDAVTAVPGRPEEFYFGAVNGGVWKTVDAGRVWEPVFDGQPVASIGAITVAPSAPDTVYVGTGENTL